MDEDKETVILNGEKLSVEIFRDLDQEVLPCSSCKTGEGFTNQIDAYDVFDARGNKLAKDDPRWDPAADLAKKQNDHDKVVCLSCIEERVSKRAAELEDEEMNEN